MAPFGSIEIILTSDLRDWLLKKADEERRELKQQILYMLEEIKRADDLVRMAGPPKGRPAPDL